MGVNPEPDIQASLFMAGVGTQGHAGIASDRAHSMGVPGGKAIWQEIERRYEHRWLLRPRRGWSNTSQVDSCSGTTRLEP